MEFWLQSQLTIMGLAVGFSTPALGLDGMVLCSTATLTQQQLKPYSPMSIDLIDEHSSMLDFAHTVSVQHGKQARNACDVSKIQSMITQLEHPLPSCLLLPTAVWVLVSEPGISVYIVQRSVVYKKQQA